MLPSHPNRSTSMTSGAQPGRTALDAALAELTDTFAHFILIR